MPNPLEMLENLKGEKSLTDFAGEIGCSVSYLHDVMVAGKAPGKMILNFLDLEVVKQPRVYRKKRK